MEKKIRTFLEHFPARSIQNIFLLGMANTHSSCKNPNNQNETEDRMVFHRISSGSSAYANLYPNDWNLQNETKSAWNTLL